MFGRDPRVPAAEAADTDTPSSHPDPESSAERGHRPFRAPDLFAELKRRQVYRVGAAWLAVAFAVLEGADLVFPSLGVPPAAYNGLVLVAVLGFPLALFLAWTFDVTPAGEIRREGAAGPDASAGGETASSPKSGAVAVPGRWDRLKAALVGAGFVAVLVLGVRMWKGPVTGSTATSVADDGAPTVPLDAPVLAVLPFDDLSPGGDQAYFADGLHEEVLHQLAVLRGIGLISRTSVEHFRGSPATVRAIADSLGARYALEGSVRRAGDSVRVTVQLIDAAADEHLWSESYDARLALDEIFAVQRQLAVAVARSLGGTLRSGQGARLGRSPTSSLEAYNLYLRALYNWHRFTADGLAAALTDVEAALALDPEFGRAHGLLGLLMVVKRNWGLASAEEAFPIVRREAELAMRLAPDEPASHLALASVDWTLEWDWAAARRDLERALELDPGNPDARWALAEWHGVIAGDTERGLREVEIGRRFDPLSSTLTEVEAWILLCGRRWAEAAEVLRPMREANPTDLWTAATVAWVLARAGRTDEARLLVAEAGPDMDDRFRISLVAALAALGEQDAARDQLAQALAYREAGGAMPASSLAAGFAAVGEIETALNWLERSFHEEGGDYTLRHPWFDPLHGEPRFQAIWDELGLPGPRPTG
jgi:adenylate cyclase